MKRKEPQGPPKPPRAFPLCRSQEHPHQTALRGFSVWGMLGAFRFVGPQSWAPSFEHNASHMS